MALTTIPPALDPSLYIPDLRSKKRDAALAQMVEVAREVGAVRDSTLVLELLKLREKVGGTGVGKGVALPHARSVAANRPVLVIARSRRGVEWGATDGLPATIVLLTLAPGEWPDESWHGLIARAASLARLQRHRQKLLAAETSAEVAALLREVAG